MKIAIVADAWFPRVNGVATTLNSTGTQPRNLGRDVLFIGLDRFRTVPWSGTARISSAGQFLSCLARNEPFAKASRSLVFRHRP